MKLYFWGGHWGLLRMGKVMEGLRRLAIAAAALALIGTAMVAAPANATGGPLTPATPSVDGVVTVCPGVSYNSLTDDVGTPLTKQQVAVLAEHMEFRCAHPNMGRSGAAVHSPNRGKARSGGVVTPSITNVLGGYLAAYLNRYGASLNWSTSASSLPTGYKTLTCEIQWNYGSWTQCGSASTTGTYLSTRDNYICPAPGQHVEVEAWLDFGGQYWDLASINT